MEEVNMKNIILFILLGIILNLFCYWAIKQSDSAYELRAKSAGYELPVEQARK